MKMNDTKFLLESIPDTNLYLITAYQAGQITDVGVSSVERLIDIWADKHKTGREVLIQGLHDGAEIELYD